MSAAVEKPPLTIKGGNGKGLESRDTTIAVHWLTATIMPPGWPNEYSATRLAERLCASVTGKGRPYPNSYTDAVELDPGRISWHHSEPRMKLCFNLTGSDCEQWYSEGRFISSTIRDLVSGEANLTRIDAAIDYHGEAEIGEVVDLFESEPGWTKARTVVPYQELRRDAEGVSRAWSGVYIGSRSSQRFLRVYDKARETGIDGQWTRIELVTRDSYAAALGESIVINGLPDATRGMIRQVADPPLDWWQEAVSGGAAESPPVGRKVTDTDRWLIETVLPVLERRLLLCENTGSPLFAAYDTTLNKHRRRLHLVEKAAQSRG